MIVQLAQQELMWLLYIVFEIRKHMPRDHDGMVWSTELLHAFRYVWFYTCLFGLTADNIWKDHWRNAMAAFSKCSPCLLGESSAINSDLEANGNMFETTAVGPRSMDISHIAKNIKRVRSLLSNLFPNGKSSNMSVSAAQGLYVLSVYHSEVFAELRFSRVFGYLSLCDSNIEPLMQAIVVKVLISKAIIYDDL